MPIITRQYDINQQVWFVDGETLTAFSGIVVRIFLHAYKLQNMQITNSVRYEIFSPETSEYFIVPESYVASSEQDVSVLLVSLSGTNFCPNFSPTPTPTVTPTGSPISPTPTPSATVTVTPTPEVTPSITPSATVTVTPTPEVTPTVTPTPSGTGGGNQLLTEGGSPMLTESGVPLIS